MTSNPDNLLDEVSGLEDGPGAGLGIPTSIPTKCRDLQGTGPAALESREVSPQFRREDQMPEGSQSASPRSSGKPA
jgi:hypothetical protein